MDAMMKLFSEFMDQIFYEGFTEEISKSDPERFEFEWNQFFRQF